MATLQQDEAPVSVFITGELSRRAPKTTDYLKEKRAIQDLAAQMADRPGEIMPKLVDLALEMTGSVTGGLSLFEPDPAPGIFRWHHLRGYLEKFTGETTPRMFSPCGVTLDQNMPVLSRRPERTYTWLQDAGISLPELLLVPLYVGSTKPIGTLWLVSENEDYYDSGHARVMTELASFVGIALHVQQTEAKLHRALEQQQTLAREMNHRVNNLFAVADGMIRVSARASSTPAEMAEALSGRLHALSVAHNLVRRSIDDEVITQSTALENIVRTIMSPHQTPSGALNRFSVSGPQINLGDRSTNGFAMVLHELATNAAKYGALASDDGIVAITWMEKNAELVMQWQESGGPQIDETPQKKGFGSILSQNVIVSQLSGTIDYDWRSAGLSVDIKVPIKSLIA